MSRTRAGVFVALAWAVTAAAWCEPVLTAYRAQVTPVVDGDLKDACWQGASFSSSFLLASEAGRPQEQTQVRLCWDEQNLYLAIEAFERNLDPVLNMLHLVRAEKIGRGASVWDDDCVEVFLQAPGQPYYHFAANSGTGTYQARGAGETWDCGWRCAAKRGTKSYTLEMAIPLAALGGKAAGDWRVNFARERTAVRENSTWSGLRGAFHQPSAFGVVRFAEQGPVLGPAELVRGLEDYRLQVAVGGADAERSILEAEVRAGKTVVGERATGAGPRDLRLALPSEAFARGAVEITYALRVGDTVIARSAPLGEPVDAGLADFTCPAKQASVVMYLNGQVVTGALPLPLRPGLNLLAVAATATGAEPELRPLVKSGGQVVPVVWQARGDQAADWQQKLTLPGWRAAPHKGDGVWGLDRNSAYLACGLYVGTGGPQLFPKSDTCYLPRGSRQLVRLYVHAPKDVPAEGAAMAVEVPRGVKCVGVEPSGGAAPRVSLDGTRERRGVPMSVYHLTYDDPPGQGMELSLCWNDAGGQTISYQPSIASGGTHGWKHFTMTVRPPATARGVHPLVIKWQDRGTTGTFWVDNVVLREKTNKQNLLKMGTFDEPAWGAQWLIAPEGADGSKCVKMVSTPETANQQMAIWVDKEGVVPVDPAKEYVVELDAKCDRLGSPTAKPMCGLLLEAPLSMAEREYPVYAYLQAAGGAITELPRVSRMVVLPPLKNVRPKTARICPCYYGSAFRNPDVAKAFADNCYASGITWTYGGFSNDVVKSLHPRGHKTVWSIGWDPWHAPPGTDKELKAHPELQAVTFAGNKIEFVYCPTWLLKEGAEPLKRLDEWLVATVNAEPYAGANWDLEQGVADPGAFCVCERCREAFRVYAKLPAEAKLDGDSLLKTYRKQWVDFRCDQNAQMAARIRAALAKAKRHVEFSLYSGYQCQDTKERYGVDWAMMAPHLDLGIAGYGGGRGVIYDTVAALGKTPFMGGEMWYLSPDDDSEATPDMRTWRNRVLRQYLESGCKGCLIWWLPPMDGGAFFATSEATEIIAKYEGYFDATRRCDAQVKVAGVPTGDWAAYARDGKVLVVLLNFGDRKLGADVTVAGRVLRCEVPAFGYNTLLIEGK